MLKPNGSGKAEVVAVVDISSMMVVSTDSKLIEVVLLAPSTSPGEPLVGTSATTVTVGVVGIETAFA